MFSFKIFIGVSDLCDFYLHLALKAIFSCLKTCFWSTIEIMLRWFIYFKTAFKVASLVLLTKGLSFEYLEISEFCTILEKNYLKPRQLLD